MNDAVVVTTAREFLGAHGHDPADVDRMHAAFTKAVLLHVTAWTRPYVPSDRW